MTLRRFFVFFCLAVCLVDHVSADNTYPRKVVMEEGTGTWCGWCVRGIEASDRLKKEYPDNFIAIGVHYRDDMSEADNYGILLEKFSTYPNSYINRTTQIDPTYVAVKRIIEAEKDNAVAKITAKAQYATYNGTSVMVETESTFGFSDPDGSRYSIAYVLVEDNVGPYTQKNSYSDPSAGHTEDIMDEWVHKESKVDILFNDVARGIYGGYTGTENSMPVSITEGETYTSQYTFTLPKNIIQDRRNLRIITLLLDTKSGEILNADQTTIDGEIVSGKPYAVISDDKTTLTFYYDYEKESRGGMGIQPFTLFTSTPWHSYCGTITTVVFNSSFAACPDITSTAYWFDDCSQLTTIEGIENLNTSEVTNMSVMFSGCNSLTSLDLHSLNTAKVTDMACMFYDCSSLESIVLPQDLVSIGESAFRECRSLKTITLPDAVQSIGTEAFFDCVNLSEVSLNEGLRSIGDEAFNYCGKISELVFPLSLEQMGSKAFYFSDYGVQHVYVKWKENPFVGSGDEIEISSFSDVILHVPVGTKTLYESVQPWKNFSLMVEMVEPSDDPNIINFADDIVRELCLAVWDTDGNQYLSKQEAAAVTDLGEVFMGNQVIRTFDELKFFTGLTSIPSMAFKGCQKLISVTLPNQVESIGNSAFANCRRMTSIIIPNSVTTIDDYAFEHCYDLSSVTFGSMVKNIGRCCFDYCSSLTSVYAWNAVPPSINERTFSNRANATLYIPSGCAAAYTKEDYYRNYWKEFGQIQEIGVTNIVNHILDRIPEGFDVRSVDVNCDGKVNIADVISLVKIVLP